MRVIDPWNNLPPDTGFSSLNAFKHSVVKVDVTYCFKRYLFSMITFLFYFLCLVFFQCFDAVGWVAGRASSL